MVISTTQTQETIYGLVTLGAQCPSRRPTNTALISVVTLIQR